MNIECMRMWKDELRNPATGVNAKLLSVPRDLEDGQPEPVAVIDETQYYWSPGATIPKKVLDESAPFVLITRASPEMVAAMPGAPEMPEGNDEVDLLALYIGFATAAPGQGPHHVMRDAMHTMRAVRRTTEEWLGGDNSPARYAARCRNDVQIVAAVRAVTLNISEAAGGAYVGAGFVLGLQVTDRWALNITP